MLKDALLGHRIEHCYHALALNENRSNQRDLRLELSNTGREKGQKCKQVWFTGSSGDIGGSYSVRELADLTRIWMAVGVSFCYYSKLNHLIGSTRSDYLTK